MQGTFVYTPSNAARPYWLGGAIAGSKRMPQAALKVDTEEDFTTTAREVGAGQNCDVDSVGLSTSEKVEQIIFPFLAENLKFASVWSKEERKKQIANLMNRVKECVAANREGDDSIPSSEELLNLTPAQTHKLNSLYIDRLLEKHTNG